MKLYIVAAYDINGKKLATAQVIDGSNNLAKLNDLTIMWFPTTDEGYIAVSPTFILMCKSRKEAVKVAGEWREGYRKEGKLYDFSPIDRVPLVKTVA